MPSLTADPDDPGREPEEADGEDSDEFSSQGVEIEVTPAGKATRRLSLLSGGEKALVALAFVFSVFLARPSPFYILDEVEAALDDANIDRFLQLVNRFSDRAQFIIVTHQKRTMDAAEVLYGVSMGKGGVTKVVSRRFDDAQPGRSSARRPKPPEYPPAPMEWEELIPSAAGPPPDAEPRAGARARRRSLRAPARAALEEPPGAARRALGQPLRQDRRRDLGAARGGADPRRRRRQGDRRGRRARSSREVDAGRGQRPGGDPRAAGRAARRDRRAASRRSSTSARSRR